MLYWVDCRSFTPSEIEILKKFPTLNYLGLSLHIGSQLFDFAALEEAIVKTLILDSQIETLGFKSQTLDVGGGIGIAYQDDAENSDQQNLQKFLNP